MPYDGRLLSGVTVLMAVVEAGSMARAAEGLGLTASGVGRAIQRLEARIGVRLLDRTTRTMRLTDEGRLFYERVGPHLDGIEEAAQEASGSTAIVRGRLRVNVDPFFSQLVLADKAAVFLQRYPDVRLELIMRDAVGDLVADGFDLALRFGDPPVGSFIARKLFETRVLTVAAPSYLKRRGCPAHPTELKDHATIDFWDAAHGRAYDWEFQRPGETLPVRVDARLVTSDAPTMLSACLAGGGIAQVLEFATRTLVRVGKLVELFADWPDEMFPLYALYPSRHHRPAKVKAFVDYVIELLSTQRMEAECERPGSGTAHEQSAGIGHERTGA
jgi:DNA-binding transcriptional LysR family regulator